MRRTRFVNAQTLSLGATINAATTSVLLSDASSLPSEGDFNITIASEIMLVTHRTTNTLTVVRAQDGTNSAIHNNGATVQVIATKTGMDKVEGDAGLLLSTNPTNLTVNTANFSWSNQGTSSLVQNSSGGIAMLTQNASPHSLRIAYMSAPSEPWTLTGHVEMGPGSEGTATGSHAGLILGDSGTTRWETIGYRLDSSFNWWEWGSPTSFGSTTSTCDLGMCPEGIWMRWVI